MASSGLGRLSALVVAIGFVVATTTTWIQLTEARTFPCRFYESIVNVDFEFFCTKLEKLRLRIVCKSCNPDVWGNLPGPSPNNLDMITFENCNFPPGLSLLNVTKALGVATNYSLQIMNACTLLRREHLADLHLDEFRFYFDSKIDMQLPGDLLHDLQANFTILSDLSLTSIPLDFFKGASKLRHLELYGWRELRRLCRHDFTGLNNLEELSLYFNAIEAIESGSFDQLDNLKHLFIVGNRLHTLPLDIFRRLVHLETVTLSGNWFDELPSDLLRIDGNKLQRFWIFGNKGSMRDLPSGFFRNLSGLEYVQLTSNAFTSIPDDVFHGASSLETLNISGNKLTSLPAGLFLGASSLETLDISGNKLTSLPAGLFDGTSLVEIKASNNRFTTLPEGLFDKINLKGLYLNQNLFSNMTRYTGFSGLNNLKTLDLSENNLSYIEPQICEDLKQVYNIDLSYNRLDLIGREMPDADGLSVLLNCFHDEEFVMPNAIDFSIGSNGDKGTYFRSLDLEGNRITHVKIKLLELLNPGVTLNLGNNEISMVDLEDLESVADDYFHKNDVSKNTRVSLKNNPLNCDCRLLNFFRYFEGKLDPNVYDLINIEPKELKCTNPPQFEGKPINTIPSEELSCLVASNETTSDDACNRNCTCSRFPGKKVLSVDCSYRNLTSVPPMVHVPYDWSIEFNMSGNHLRSTPRMNVSYLANVTTLDLSFNSISQVTRDVFSSNALRVLKLHNNDISRLEHDVVQYLSNDDLTLTNLTLHGNPYICDCQTRDMFNFVLKKLSVFEMHNVTCRDNNRRLYQIMTDELCPGANSIAIIVAFCAGCIAFISILTVFYFKYEMKIKIWLYSKQWCLWFVTEDELDKDKIYDAFISFSHKDEDFVEKEIVAKLEQGPMPYKLCLHHRDWIAGEWIPAQIVRSVEESRRTIIIMSPNFLESVWGRMEFRTAHNQALIEGRARVIVVLYGEIGNTEELEPELKAYLSMNTYLKWGDPWFWDRLRYALPHKRELSKKQRRSRNARAIESLHKSRLATNDDHREDREETMPMTKITAQPEC